ncbi:uncharacterized protein JN550_000407 [Neoarthrinium moseri]|uniref:uncharacterized protein n=1 Tax=Neoarthrinium moseri TaxID=1658444 RepID=UPI001FDB0754|nr:uncharacterized protein JN550_000407 [Neoarthrinium moseri]KAI1878225.1 hypothetical protein JN550_000407 [Neoarthrinium moseri]
MEALQQALPDRTLPTTTLGGHDQSQNVKNYTVQPTSSEEVSRFIKVIKPLVLKGKTTFAIRDGGVFSPPGDKEARNDTIILDLSQMTGVSLRPDGIAAIGAGERWDNVLENLGKSNVSTTSWRNGGRGIGKLALEAGLSFFSSNRGFVSDNVANYEVVLASEDIVHANAKDNPDLWASLKGGSNNFGIVTRYDMETFPQGPMWGGYVYYYPPKLPRSD